MKRSEWIRHALLAGKDLHYTRQRHLRHNAINLTSLAIVLGLGGVVVMGAGHVPPWLYIPIGSVLLGRLVFALFILVVHECSHEMFLLLADAKRSRKLNHRIGWLFAALLFTDYRNHWEKGHLRHHLYPLDRERDPQTPDPLDGRRLLARMRFLLLPGGALFLNPSRGSVSVPRLILGFAVWGGVAYLGASHVSWQVPVAIVLAFNVTAFLNLIRIAQEHGSGLFAEEDPYLRTRSYFYGASILASPFNINYHWEHHANLGVPWYALPTFHRRVLAIMPAELQPYLVTRGWRAFFAQLAGRRPLPPAALRPLLGGSPSSVRTADEPPSSLDQPRRMSLSE